MQNDLLAVIKSFNPWTIATSPVTPMGRFVLILMALPITAFFFIYSVLGLVLEGNGLRDWRFEAWSVTLGVLMILGLYQSYVLLLCALKRVLFPDPLYIAAIAHFVVAMGCVAIVYMML